MPADDSHAEAAGRSSPTGPVPSDPMLRPHTETDTAAAPTVSGLPQPARVITITTGTGLAAGVAAFLGGAQLATAPSLSACHAAAMHARIAWSSHPFAVPSRAGAAAVGVAHYMGSTKALAEEGIDPRVRLRAIPMAVRLSVKGSPHVSRACLLPAYGVLMHGRQPVATLDGVGTNAAGGRDVCPMRSFRHWPSAPPCAARWALRPL